MLVTGFDIIFFWVARMMMLGLHFMGEVPFRRVFINALSATSRARRCPSPRATSSIPWQLIDDYGADALRFTLAAMAGAGARHQAVATSASKAIAISRTKLWNAARFAEMNGCVGRPWLRSRRSRKQLNRWILGETARAVARSRDGAGRLSLQRGGAGGLSLRLEHFLRLASGIGQAAAARRRTARPRQETRETIAFVLDQILQAAASLHALHHRGALGDQGRGRRRAKALLALAAWPDLKGLEDAEAEAEIGWVVDLVSQVRSVRAEMNVPAGAQIPLALVGAERGRRRTAPNAGTTCLKRLARLSEIDLVEAAPPHSVQMISRGTSLALPLEGVIDFAAERARLEKGHRGGAEGDLQNRRQARQRRFPAPRARGSGRGKPGPPRTGGGEVWRR